MKIIQISILNYGIQLNMYKGGELPFLLTGDKGFFVSKGKACLYNNPYFRVRIFRINIIFHLMLGMGT